jgi:hypothetical protein
MKPLHILVIGTGRYTCGRGTEDQRTLLILSLWIEGCK